MIRVHGVSRSCTGFALVVLFCLTGMVVTRAEDTAKSPDEAYLDALKGAWVMEGTIGDKSVRYLVEGQRVLQDKFVKLHIADTGPPPKYEADVYIGFDAKAKDYIAHWLDRFGAPGARVVARGDRQGQRLVLIFPYAEGAFRDTFTWQPESRSWSALLESQSGADTWSIFASYTLSRRTLPR